MLPTISNSGNDIAGAMRALRTYALTYGGRPFVQKVALTFVDQRASRRRVLEDNLQVLVDALATLSDVTNSDPVVYLWIYNNVADIQLSSWGFSDSLGIECNQRTVMQKLLSNIYTVHPANTNSIIYYY